MVSCAMNMSAGQSDDPGRASWDSLKVRVKKLWDNSPEPVKCFPWNEALNNFIQLIADLILSVIKYLSVPLLVVTSLSEMSYCAHEKKLLIVPFPLIIGFSVAEVMRQTALSLSPILKVRFQHHRSITCETLVEWIIMIVYWQSIGLISSILALLLYRPWSMLP